MCRNNIDGLIGSSIRVWDGSELLFYDISSRQNLIRMTERKELEFEDVKDLFYSLRDAVNEAERFLLNPMFLLFNPEFIYRNLSTNRIEWIFYPSDTEPVSPEGLTELGEFLLEKVNHKNPDAVEVVYRFYRDTKEESFLLNNTIEMIEKIRSGLSAETIMPVNEQGEFFQDAPEPYFFADPEKQDTEQTPGIISKIVSFFTGWRKGKKDNDRNKNGNEDFDIMRGERRITKKEEDVQGDFWMKNEEKDYEETVLIGRRGGEERRELTEIRSGRVYSLEKLPVIVGKLPEEVDICLTDPSVSRLHARIYEENQTLWFEDCNSRNGSIINDLKLEANEKVQIAPGDRICIGTVEFLYN